MKIKSYKNGRFELEDGTTVPAPIGARGMDLFVGIDSQYFDAIFHGEMTFEQAVVAGAPPPVLDKDGKVIVGDTNVQMGRQQAAASRRDSSILSRRLSRLH